MFCSKSFVDDVICSMLPSSANIEERIEKSSSEVDLKIHYLEEMKIVKIFNVGKIKEKMILKLLENSCLLLSSIKALNSSSKIHQLSNDGYVILERGYYLRDLEEIIQSNYSISDVISDIICSVCNILIVMSDCSIEVSNLKSSNIVYGKDDKMKLCDLFINYLRREEDMRIYDVCFTSPEELNGLECNERSVIWSIGCILYEIMNRKLPFNEDDNMMKTMNNIMRCKYNCDVECDDMMKEMIFRMLKVKNEDRMSIKELKTEMIKMSEILRDEEDNIMICNERKDILYYNDYNSIITLPIIFPPEYYLEIDNEDDLVKLYNKKPNEIILSSLLKMNLDNGYHGFDYENMIGKGLKFQVYHECKESGNVCCLDNMVYDCNCGENDDNTINVYGCCVCFCEEGIDYFFRILKVVNPKTLRFYYENFYIPFKYESLFGSYFYQLTNLQELDLSMCNVNSDFIEQFVKSIPFMKLNNLDLCNNPIGVKGFKLLLPYLQLLINKHNKLNLFDMSLNDESMILLSDELYKYPNLQKIDIQNNNIHLNGLKALFSKFPISKIEFNITERKTMMIENDVPELINYFKTLYYNELSLDALGIDDEFFKLFITLRSKEFCEIKRLTVRNNELTHKSVEILINNLSSFSNLNQIELYGNEIGDEGMRILSPHIHLLKDYNMINCSKMELSSIGLKYLVDGLKNVNKKIEILSISDNKIDTEGIGYLMDYMKGNDCIKTLFIHDNPIGNAGFKLLIENIKLLINYNYLDLTNISIDDESVILLADKIDSISNCNRIDLNGNNIRMNGLKLICSKTLEKEEYPFIEIKCSSWRKEECEYYLDYCIKKKRKDNKDYDFSNLNLNDSHISLIKQIDYKELDISNNKISCNGLKELTDSLPKRVEYISIYNNPIGDEGVDIICDYIRQFIESLNSLNLSNIGMSLKGLKMLMEMEILNDYLPLSKVNLSGNELDEKELRFMIDNDKFFRSMDELSITVKYNIDKSELKLFLEIYSFIARIELDGVSEEEKKELSREYNNIE